MHVAAVDLGASSGRVMLAEVGSDRLELRELHRFPNSPRTLDGHLRWDVAALRGGIVEGLRRAAAAAPDLAGIGVDSWAVDYGLLDGAGRLVADPIAYRDSRTDGALERIHRVVPAEELYAVTGIQELPFNTLVQLTCDEALPAARTLLHRWLGDRPAGTAGPAGGRPAAAGRPRDGARPGAARRPGRPGPAGNRSGGERGLARHGFRGGRRPDGRTRDRRLHLLRHLVAGRPGAGRAGADRGRPGRQLHQRGGRRRHRALPAQRDGPLAAAGVAAQLAGRG